MEHSCWLQARIWETGPSGENPVAKDEMEPKDTRKLIYGSDPNSNIPP